MTGVQTCALPICDVAGGSGGDVAGGSGGGAGGGVEKLKDPEMYK